VELRNLRALIEIAKRGGFSSAAKGLGTTQSTVSKAIQQLEHDCGLQLIERLGRGIRLTDAGELVLRRAENMLSEREHLFSELDDLRGLQRGKLKLGLPLMASSVLFANLVAAFRKRYPLIEVELEEQGSHQLEDDVRKGRIEVGATLVPNAEDFECRMVKEEPLMALLPVDHPLANRTSLRLEDLAPCRAILFEEGFMLNSIIQAAFRKRKLTLIDVGRSPNADFMMAMVAAGIGVAFLPQLILNTRDHTSVRAVVMEEDDMWWRLALIWRRGRVLSPAAQRWLEMAAAPLSGLSGKG
jgi:DNA-binding transcriptional LysR family regulator